jgi:hypothetical protein
MRLLRFRSEETTRILASPLRWYQGKWKTPDFERLALLAPHVCGTTGLGRIAARAEIASRHPLSYGVQFRHDARSQGAILSRRRPRALTPVRLTTCATGPSSVADREDAAASGSRIGELDEVR